MYMKKRIAALITGFALINCLPVWAEGDVRVSYLGPAGTYTEEAAQFFFQSGETMTPAETVNDAIADLLSGEADYAVIPQEITVGGAVVNYVDALIGAEDAFVAGERKLWRVSRYKLSRFRYVRNSQPDWR